MGVGRPMSAMISARARDCAPVSSNPRFPMNLRYRGPSVAKTMPRSRRTFLFLDMRVIWKWRYSSRISLRTASFPLFSSKSSPFATCTHLTASAKLMRPNPSSLSRGRMPPGEAPRRSRAAETMLRMNPCFTPSTWEYRGMILRAAPGVSSSLRTATSGWTICRIPPKFPTLPET